MPYIITISKNPLKDRNSHVVLIEGKPNAIETKNVSVSNKKMIVRKSTFF